MKKHKQIRLPELEGAREVRAKVFMQLHDYFCSNAVSNLRFILWSAIETVDYEQET